METRRTKIFVQQTFIQKHFRDSGLYTQGPELLSDLDALETPVYHILFCSWYFLISGTNEGKKQSSWNLGF